jgi:hypothetical protein
MECRADHFQFSLYRKSIATNLYMNQSSFHPCRLKVTAFHALAHRLTHVPMHPETYHAERYKIFKIGF